MSFHNSNMNDQSIDIMIPFGVCIVPNGKKLQWQETRSTCIVYCCCCYYYYCCIMIVITTNIYYVESTTVTISLNIEQC